MDEMSYVRSNRDGESGYCHFYELKKGDTFFRGGVPHVVDIDAHFSVDSSYDGYLLYDEDGNDWYPEDLDGK